MTFKEFLAEISSSMPPGTINPYSTPTGKLPTMPTDGQGNPLGSPMDKQTKKELTGGPFSVSRYGLNKKREVGLSGAGKDMTPVDPPPGPFTSRGIWSPGPQKLNMGKQAKPIPKPLH